MFYYEVAPTKIFRAGADVLTYHHDSPLPPGTLVTIPLGKTTIPGLILKKVQKPTFTTKPITSILYDTPIPAHLLHSLLWLRDYYFCPLPTILQTALPKGITKTRRPSTTLDKTPTPTDNTPPQIPLNPAQTQALKQITTSPKNTLLLHGITGSGKTNIYLHLAHQAQANKQSTILLVPEIALTSQLVHNFQKHFKNVILLHSKQTESERHQLWEQILSNQNSKSESTPAPNTEPLIIIGPRSALFAPIHNLGLIIIDEAHESTYHQDQSPKYSALQLASRMTALLNHNITSPVGDIDPDVPSSSLRKALTLLGSATPNIADYYLANQQKAIITLSELAIKSDKTAQTTLIDLKDRTKFKKHRLLSDQLLSSIQNSLDNHTQSMIFHNRRGSAPITLCTHCGWQALCASCLLPLTLHSDHFSLICHTCGAKTPVPTSCPTCKNADIIHKGFGTKFLESELTRLFPHARIARFDTDTETSKTLQNTYLDVRSGHIDIIIGTQTIAKGFDFPLLTTLGIAQADAGLSLPDFSSEEHTFQLLTQVIGRANRGHQNSNIFIQTYQPDHPAVRFGATSDYQNFYTHLIKTRQRTALPPYRFLLQLSITYKTEPITIKNITKLRSEIQNLINKSKLTSISISSPTPAFHERTPSGYTWQLLIKSTKRQPLINILASLPPNPHLRFHLDPPSLL